MRNLIIDTKKENLKGSRRIIIINSEHIDKIFLNFPNTLPSSEITIEIKTNTGVTTLTSNKNSSREKEEHMLSLLVKIYEKVFSDGSLRNQLASEKFGL